MLETPLSSMLTVIQGKLPSMGMGERIAARLDELQTDVATLAKHCGVSGSAVYQWISGETKGMKPENLVNCARFLRVHLAWLVFEQGPKERSIARQDLSPDEGDLISGYRLLDEGQQEAILAAVKNLGRGRKKKAS